MPAKKAPAATSAEPTREAAAEALVAAVETLKSAAAAFAKADTGRTTHVFIAEGYRVLFMGEQLSSVVPM